MFNNWWILVFPVAVSQLTVFWNLIMQKATSVGLPATSVELITPLLAAFLSAHVLSAEYPARVGAILASKPLNIGKVVLLRLGAVLALVWVLELISLAAYYYGMGPYDVRSAFLASVPSTLFLAMLATTFATLFRHPLAGFGVAILYWALDLPSGPPLNPFGTLKSYSIALTSLGPNMDGLVRYWWVAKAALLAGALLLYMLNARLVFRLGVPATQRARRRAVGFAVLLLASNMLIGAVAKVSYGFQNRGDLFPNDGAWFRRQFAGFGPIPVTYLFGTAFRYYIGDIPNAWRFQQEGESDLLGATTQHERSLHEVVDRMSGSMWAPSSAELLARLTGRQQPTLEKRIAVFQSLADRFPNSPYVGFAIRQKALSFDGENRFDDARAAYEELLRLRPNSSFRTEALRYIVETERKRGNHSVAEKWAREWIRSATIRERPSAYVALAEAQRSQGNAVGATESSKQALQAFREYRKTRIAINAQAAPDAQELKWDREANEAEVKAHSF